MVAANPIYGATGFLKQRQRNRGYGGIADVCPLLPVNGAISAKSVKGSGPDCDFLFVNPGAGCLTVAIGAISGPYPQTRSACALAARTIGRRARMSDTPSRVLGRLHNNLARWNDLMPEPGLNCSAVCCLFDLERGVMRYANGDHPSPVAWTRSGQRVEPGCVGEVIGLSFLPERNGHKRSEELCIEERQIALGDLQRIIYYTRGIVGAATAFLGEPADRYLSDLMDASTEFSIEDQLDTLLAGTLGRLANAADCHQDVTLLGVDVIRLRAGADPAAAFSRRLVGL